MPSRQTDADDVNHGIVIENVPYFDGDTAAIVEHAVAAEEVGWDGVFTGDHLCYSPDGQPQAEFDPWITMVG
jgi:alkanesulfonate monooxygenase SsuD/methylene tetrahydromethanopterin reductase-like flavin-dependent oxidoreductase (luciferase family)